MSDNEKDNQKIAKTVAKMLEASVAATDLSGKVQDAIALQQAMQTQQEQTQSVQRPMAGNQTPADIQAQKAEGVKGQIETAGEMHQQQKEKTIGEDTPNNSNGKSNTGKHDEPEKKMNQMKDNGKSATQDVPERKTNQSKQEGQSTTQDQPQKKGQMKENGESITGGGSSKGGNDKESKLQEFRENKESITQSNSGGNGGGSGGKDTGKRSNSTSPSTNNNNDPNKNKYNGPSY